MFVYVIVCSESLKLYVGQHQGADLGRYLSRKFYDARRYSEKRSHLYAAMRKHPRETWSIWPLVSGIETRVELDELEKHFIRVLKTQEAAVGYNICRGGEGYTGPGYWLGKKRPGFAVPKRPGWRNTTTFEKGSVPWNVGKRGVQLAWNKNKPMVYASADSKQRALSCLVPGNSKGKHHSLESRARMSASHKGIPWSAARRKAQKTRLVVL